VKSIKNSNQIKNFEIVVVADLTPVKEQVKKELKNMNVTFIENNKPTSAFAKQKQILKTCKSDVIVLTQDDVIFEDTALYKIVQTFVEHPDISFVGIRNEPMKSRTVFERGVNVGTRLNNTIGESWRDGDNYLAMLGRVMAFRGEWLKNRLQVHSNSVSLDAYMYFENKRNGGGYKCLWDTCLYFRNPGNMKEQMRKSSRFQNSKYEMESYNKFENLEFEYDIPLRAIFFSVVKEFLRDPVGFVVYLYIYTYTRLKKFSPEDCLTALWEVDLSTKNLEAGKV
jgi:hypothetical protein